MTNATPVALNTYDGWTDAALTLLEGRPNWTALDADGSYLVIVDGELYFVPVEDAGYVYTDEDLCPADPFGWNGDAWEEMTAAECRAIIEQPKFVTLATEHTAPKRHTFICDHCGRVYDEEEGPVDTCPSDDCPSHEEAAATDSDAEMNEYALDVTIRTSLRVKAVSLEEARRMVQAEIDGNSVNLGAWPDGSPILGEASVSRDDAMPCYEVNGDCGHEDCDA